MKMIILGLVLLAVGCSPIKESSAVLLKKNANASNKATTLVFETKDSCVILRRTFLPDRYVIGKWYDVRYMVSYTYIR